MSSSNRQRHLAVRGMLGLALSSVLVLGASNASADPALPKLLADHWKMPCVPSCAVCHLDANGGPGRIRTTVNGKTGFGGKLLGYGLDVSTPSSINAALDIAKDDKSDVDGDGHTDFDELSVGDDPNDPAQGASVCGTGPEFGCVRIARQGPVDGVGSVSAAAVLALGLAALRRRRVR
jgi:hypothetical protein